MDLSSKSKKSLLGSILNRLSPYQNSWRLFLLRSYGVEIESSCIVGANITTRLGFSNGRRGSIYIGSKSKIDQGVVLDCWGGSIILEENVFLGPCTIIYGHGGVNLGKDTLISMHCRIISSNHTIPDQNTLIRSQPDILLPVTIGKDVWLGAGVTILGGVTVGDGCVVGAGTVVTQNLPPYSVSVGVPAKVIKTRE
jgi:acetyltransferase-like isoleucine patch superfamily enzyme